MIGTIDIRVNAAHPNLSLDDLYTFVGSPSTVRIANVPEKIGQWQIVRVMFAITYPDNAIRSVVCKRVSDSYVGSVNCSTSAGKSLSGYQVIADCVDENGTTRNGYVLGVGDVYVMDRDGTVTVDGETYYLHLLDAVPDTPHKGDVILSGEWKIYSGSEWKLFGGREYRAGQGLKLEGAVFSLDGTLSSYLPLSGGYVTGDVEFADNKSIILPKNANEFTYSIWGRNGTVGRYFEWKLPIRMLDGLQQTIALRKDLQDYATKNDLSAKVDGDLITPTRTIPLGLYWGDENPEAKDLIAENDGEFKDFCNEFAVTKTSNGFYVKCTDARRRVSRLVHNTTTGQYTGSENVNVFFGVDDVGKIHDGDEDYDDICVAKDVVEVFPTRVKTLDETFASRLSGYYNKGDTDARLSAKADISALSGFYGKGETDAMLSSKVGKGSEGSYTETQTEDNNAFAWGFSFVPSAFGMKDNSYIKSFTVKTRLSTATPQPTTPIYYKLVDRSSGTDVVLGVVAEGKLMTEWNTPISFTFDRKIKLRSNKRYYLMSYNSPTATSTTNVGLRLSHNETDTRIYYNDSIGFRPILTVQFEEGEVLDTVWNELEGVYTKSEVNALIQQLREELQ